MRVGDFKELTIAKLDDLIDQRNEIMKAFLVDDPASNAVNAKFLQQIEKIKLRIEKIAIGVTQRHSMNCLINEGDKAGTEMFKDLFGRLVMCKLECVFSIKTLTKDRSSTESQNNLLKVLFDNEDINSSESDVTSVVDAEP